ncbi:MAG: hypothetical protein Sylvanvirus28_7 [Sylvanvirus sp.]|uniref:Uncharacterized protein n=1 Tax=Sylvanvirus sp. TaxID=2487774 RepID=A0A3G5ALE4_9VIRU|nr:MAG: hypothetical protein Sylvanvirus28_7 [Sylvanvirus sp.]
MSDSISPRYLLLNNGGDMKGMSEVFRQMELRHDEKRLTISTVGFQLIDDSSIFALTCVHGATIQFAQEQKATSVSVCATPLGNPILDVYNEDVDFMLVRSEELSNDKTNKKAAAVFDMEQTLSVTVDSIINKLDKEGEESFKVWLDCPGGLVKCRVLRPRVRDYSKEYSPVKYNPLTHFWIKYPSTLEIKKGYSGSVVLTDNFLPMGMLRAVNSQFNAALCVLIKPVLECVMKKYPNVQVRNIWNHYNPKLKPEGQQIQLQWPANDVNLSMSMDSIVLNLHVVDGVVLASAKRL